MNISSRAEAVSLLDKLREDKSPTHAVLRFANGTVIRISGSFSGSSTGSDLVVTASHDAGYLSIPFVGRSAKFSFTDKRELSEETKSLADTWGNCALVFEFLDGDFLTFIFNLP